MTRHALGPSAAAAFALALMLAAGVLAPETAHAGPGPLTPSLKERRAVRGRAVVEPVESPAEATVRRFEDSLPDPEAGTPGASAEVLAPSVPELAGEWTGSGDEATGLELGAPGPLAALYRDFFAGDPAGQAAVGAWLDRLAPWQPACEEALAAEGLPHELLAVALAQTGFFPAARGHDGRTGPWFLAAADARAAGLTVDRWLDQRRDPVRATAAAARQLRALHARFGNWPIVLAAFHAGPELIDARRGELEKLPALDVAHLAAARAPLPRATRLFLAKVVAINEVARARQAVGAGARGGLVTAEVPAAITLETVARVTGVSASTLRELNPALLADRAAPFDAGLVSLRLPRGTRAPSPAELEAARADVDRVVAVKLRLGESAAHLGARGVPAQIAALNRVRDLDELRGPLAVLVPAALADEARSEAVTRDLGTDPPLVAVPARSFDLPGTVRRFYFVGEGDVLADIAAAAGVSVADLVSWNNLDVSARLQSRMILQLYVRPDLDPARIALVPAEAVRALAVGSDEFHALEVAQRGKSRVVHAVRPGDNMAKIARRYGLPAADLARINRMSWNSELAPGQRIVVYAPAGVMAGAAPKTAAGRSTPSKRPEPRGAHPAVAVQAKPAAKAPARPARPTAPARR